MKIRSLAAALVSAAGLALASMSAQATTGPFYNCIKTDVVSFDGTVVDAAVATPQLSTLVSLVTTAGLADTLASAEGITVYAPTNDAFAKIPQDVLGAIGGNADVLTAVLTYHVSAGTDDPRRWSNPVRRQTLAGKPIYLGFNGKNVLVNQAKVSCQGVKTTNGTVWLIDSVLLPQF